MGIFAGKTPKELEILNTLLIASTPIQIEWTVGASYKSAEGKFPSAYGNVVLTDC
jgi:hypothetical protein